MYQGANSQLPPTVDADHGLEVNEREAQQHFEDFYEDIYYELNNYGKIEELNVTDNIGPHLIGNVYVKYRHEEDAEKALKALTGRFYAGRPIICEYSPVTDFREACCRQFDFNECTRGGECNFMHLKAVSPELYKQLFGHYPKQRFTRKERGERDNDYERESARDTSRGERERGSPSHHRRERESRERHSRHHERRRRERSRTPDREEEGKRRERRRERKRSRSRSPRRSRSRSPSRSHSRSRTPHSDREHSRSPRKRQRTDEPTGPGFGNADFKRENVQPPPPTELPPQ